MSCRKCGFETPGAGAVKTKASRVAYGIASLWAGRDLPCMVSAGNVMGKIEEAPRANLRSLHIKQATLGSYCVMDDYGYEG